MTAATIHEPGVYFGMPEDEYHSDPALGSSDIRHLLISQSDYWFRSRHLNPLYEEIDTDTPARIRGRALHKLILEGQEAFEAQYQRGIDPADYPGALRTIADLKEACRKYSLSISGTKDELIARVQGRVPKLPILDVLTAELEKTGKITLKPRLYDEIMISSFMVTRNPHLADCFKGGYPEVSLFWMHDEVRLKARLDYLRISGMTDLKSIANMMERQPGHAITRAIGDHKYYLQGSHYLNGRQQLPRLVKEGRIFGDVDRDWLARCAMNANYTYTWVFYFATGAPIARGMLYPRGSGPDSTAQAMILDAIERWRDGMHRFGESSAWVDQTPVETLQQDDLPSWAYQ
ncbi:MAG: SAP domain-containing protein [Beijerinckiaceae bacterium]